MNTDSRDILDVLKQELQFIELGGYGRSVRAPQQPTSVFLDSLSCINYGDPNRSLPCNQCLLSELVPAERHAETLPCHHIPLNARGDTIQLLENEADQDKLTEVMKDWLRRSIERIEKERAAVS